MDLFIYHTIALQWGLDCAVLQICNLKGAGKGYVHKLKASIPESGKFLSCKYKMCFFYWILKINVKAEFCSCWNTLLFCPVGQSTNVKCWTEWQATKTVKKRKNAHLSLFVWSWKHNDDASVKSSRHLCRAAADQPHWEEPFCRRVHINGGGLS